jgi:hypothetical protein
MKGWCDKDAQKSQKDAGGHTRHKKRPSPSFFVLLYLLPVILSGMMRTLLPKVSLGAAVAALLAVSLVSGETRTVTLLTQADIDLAAAQERVAAAARTVCESGTCREMPAAISVIETKYDSGPKIKVVEPPPDAEFRAPIRLIITFIPREGTAVDLKSFKLEYLKFVSIDITGRVAGYVGPGGVNVEKADLPPGDHKLRITLKDTQGGISQQVYSVKIAK